MSEPITPEPVYVNRRALLKTGVAAGSVLATGWIYRMFNPIGEQKVNTRVLAGLGSTPATLPSAASGFRVDEPSTSLENIANYNNFYEFTTDKKSVAATAANFVSRPWKIEVGGLVGKPKTFDLDDFLKIAAPEERIYRMRCVERWSMVIPWDGFSLSKLLERVEPNSSAKYVAFETLYDPVRFPGQNTGVLDWPYVEGLRMDEAMHPLTILASGIYGHELPAQDGAPVRLVVPWKYGFKGIKSIVKITLTDKEPPTTWNRAAPSAYGFYANVNPQVDRPWDQSSEQRAGENDERKTLMFNGYTEQVASLYAGMDLAKYY